MGHLTRMHARRLVTTATSKGEALSYIKERRRPIGRDTAHRESQGAMVLHHQRNVADQSGETQPTGKAKGQWSSTIRGMSQTSRERHSPQGKPRGNGPPPSEECRRPVG